MNGGALCAIIPLPTEARRTLDGAISYYLRASSFASKELPPSELRDSLLRIAGIADRYVQEIRNLGPSEFDWLGNCGGWYKISDTEEGYSEELLRSTNDAAHIAEWFTYAAGEARKRENLFRDTNWVEHLVSDLDNILCRYTGLHVTRSKAPRDFVDAVFQIADPSIGRGSIEGAIRGIKANAKKQSGKIAPKKNR